MYLNCYFETKFNEYISYIYSESAFKSLENKSIAKAKLFKCQSLSRWRQRRTLRDFPKITIQKFLSKTTRILKNIGIQEPGYF